MEFIVSIICIFRFHCIWHLTEVLFLIILNQSNCPNRQNYQYLISYFPFLFSYSSICTGSCNSFVWSRLLSKARKSEKHFIHDTNFLFLFCDILPFIVCSPCLPPRHQKACIFTKHLNRPTTLTCPSEQPKRFIRRKGGEERGRERGEGERKRDVRCILSNLSRWWWGLIAVAKDKWIISCCFSPLQNLLPNCLLTNYFVFFRIRKLAYFIFYF